MLLQNALIFKTLKQKQKRQFKYKTAVAPNQ